MVNTTLTAIDFIGTLNLLTIKRSNVTTMDNLTANDLTYVDMLIAIKRSNYISLSKRLRKCTYPTCTKTPTFGPQHGTATRCKVHMYDNMTALLTKKCNHPGCNKGASFGTIYRQPRYCKQHIKSGMRYVMHRCCHEPNCTTKPSFGFFGKKPTSCKLHSSIDMINLTARECTTCKVRQANSRYRPNCGRCHRNNRTKKE